MFTYETAGKQDDASYDTYQSTAMLCAPHPGLGKDPCPNRAWPAKPWQGSLLLSFLGPGFACAAMFPCMS